MKKIKYYLKRIYRVAFCLNKQELIVWKDLKNLHVDAGWQSGVYENDKCIETAFEIGEGKRTKYVYMIYEGCYLCRVKILESFSPDITTDLFILAEHFNNILKNGVVAVNVEKQNVEYYHKKDLLMPFLYSGELYRELMMHYETSKDIYAAFQRLIVEEEAPAIIIADLLRQIEKKYNTES